MKLARVERRLLALFFAALCGLVLCAVACGSSSGGPDAGMDAGTYQPCDAGTDGMRRGGGDAKAEDAASEPDAPGPGLTTLTVVASDSAPAVTLTPAFSPSIYDYYVYCQAGMNTFTVTVTAETGATAELTQPMKTSPMSSQSVSVTVKEGDPIVATVTQGSSSSEYWVRCLPHDFPTIAWTPHAGASKLAPGYYLVGGWWPPPGKPGYSVIFDPNGVPVWYSRAPYFGTADVTALAPNQVTLFPFTTGGVVPFTTIDLKTKTKTTLQPDAYVASLHEIQQEKNGNYLIIATPLTSGVDLSGVTLTERDGGTITLGSNMTIQDCAIVEFKADGTVVSVWLGSDHFDPKAASTYAAYGAVGGTGTTAPDGGEIDIFHCNSIDIDPNTGGLLVSARHMNSVFYVDWKGSRKVLWKMGGKNSSKDNATYVSVSDPFLGQHDGRMWNWDQSCNGGTGQISVYDDQTFSTTNPARVLLFDVVVGEQDGGTSKSDGGCKSGGGKAGTATLAWEYKGIHNTGLGGSLRLNPDGTRVIGWGSYGAPGWVMTEVDECGNDLLDLNWTDGDTSYRALKYPMSTFDRSLLRSTAGIQ